jgi:hypothetical protein
MSSPILCIVLAILCALIGIFEYVRPRGAPQPYWFGPVFWPVLGLLVIEICRMGGTH